MAAAGTVQKSPFTLRTLVGGATNKLFLVTSADRPPSVLRCLQALPNEVVSRHIEVAVQSLASRVRLAPMLLDVPDDLREQAVAAGCSEALRLEAFVEGRVLKRGDFHDPASLRAVGRALRRLHGLMPTAPAAASLGDPGAAGELPAIPGARGACITVASRADALARGADSLSPEDLASMSLAGCPAPSDVHPGSRSWKEAARGVVGALRARLEADGPGRARSVVAHCDANPGNVIVPGDTAAGDGVTLIDFEYSAWAPPCVDLANVMEEACIENNAANDTGFEVAESLRLPGSLAEQLCLAYSEGDEEAAGVLLAQAREAARLVRLIWGLWGVGMGSSRGQRVSDAGAALGADGGPAGWSCWHYAATQLRRAAAVV